MSENMVVTPPATSAPPKPADSMNMAMFVLKAYMKTLQTNARTAQTITPLEYVALVVSASWGIGLS